MILHIYKDVGVYYEKSKKEKTQMSSYEDYTSTSTGYDETREPVGTEIIFDCFSKSSVPLNEMVVLDAGCGTGSHSSIIINRVKKVEAVELNLGMINKAKQKMFDAELEGRIAFHHASIDKMPIENESIDAIMVNQVFHHLPQDFPKDFSKLQEVIKEFNRVLKPGGVLVIHTCSNQQLRNGYWYSKLIPNAVDLICDKYILIDELSKMLENNGFDFKESITKALGYQGQSYFDVEGPLKASWRAGDSVWSLVPAKELELVISKVKELNNSGGMEDYIKQHDKQRPSIGQILFLHAIKRK
ncbi:MAG: ubiquinone/menaquinone biosynthesis C-methylase UbiE [Saprospiraceae bacterium]|jgi:ubiquinone/menaquinone biosynthesis C-methylase UbiE